MKLLLLLLGGLKLGKLLTTGGTMLISVAAYSFIFGWPYAVGFVLLIFVHECGHAYVLRREGIPAGAPVFIPFLGAVIATYYYLRVVVALYFPPAGDEVGTAPKVPFLTWIVIGVTAAATLVLGIFPGPLVQIIAGLWIG